MKIAQAENKHWGIKLQKYLMAYRSVPHNTTGRSPAELLFNRKMREKLPDLSLQSVHDQEVCDRDAERKAMSKAYTGTRHSASYFAVDVSDEALVKQDKTNKLSTTFNPYPFSVVSKTGNYVIVEDTTGNRYSRNTSLVKKYISPEASLETIESLGDVNETVPDTAEIHQCQNDRTAVETTLTTPLITQRPQRIKWVPSRFKND